MQLASKNQVAKYSSTVLALEHSPTSHYRPSYNQPPANEPVAGEGGSIFLVCIEYRLLIGPGGPPFHCQMPTVELVSRALLPYDLKSTSLPMTAQTVLCLRLPEDVVR
ncbi:hypothetical protein N7539_006978 [Penicillium diatomitis]|uniref:Uncharacterized protein n=1 Tax=Penicillium diatomitis TaxID=2819901 RepID=A0A9X0BSH1_9EURO|nr:uncharacterized protein N7539_006978 [Penicillium diatomitis]KAJ5481084.1 hypothetical protein N7539_006978 [Penicillium diatomitis]